MGVVENLLMKYDNRVIRALIQLVPFGIGSAVDVVLMKTIEKMREVRTKAFFDELARNAENLQERLLQDNEFIHCFLSTTKYALNTRRIEKIQMFARLLGSTLSAGGPRDADEYEDYLRILDDLTFREFVALSILDRYSSRERTADQNELQWTNTF